MDKMIFVLLRKHLLKPDPFTARVKLQFYDFISECRLLSIHLLLKSPLLQGYIPQEVKNIPLFKIQPCVDMTALHHYTKTFWLHIHCLASYSSGYRGGFLNQFGVMITFMNVHFQSVLFTSRWLITFTECKKKKSCITTRRCLLPAGYRRFRPF